MWIPTFRRNMLPQSSGSRFVVYFMTLSVSRLCSVASNGRMTRDWWTGKDLEGSSHSIIWATIPALLWKDWGKSQKKLSIDSRCSCRSNKARALPLNKTFRRREWAFFYSSTLKMEAACSSETSVILYQTTRVRRHSFKFHIAILFAHLGFVSLHEYLCQIQHPYISIQN
jgi:hypothetical protein